MKKYWVGILLLAGMLGGILLHIRHLETMIGELTDQVDKAQIHAEQGDYSAAGEEISQAMDQWERAGHYTHIFIRHDEVNEASDAFFALLGDLTSGETEAAEASCETLLYHLRSIRDMEHVSIKSVF